MAGIRPSCFFIVLQELMQSGLPRCMWLADYLIGTDWEFEIPSLHLLTCRVSTSYNGIFRVFHFCTRRALASARSPVAIHMIIRMKITWQGLGRGSTSIQTIAGLADRWRYAAGQVVCYTWAVPATISVHLHLLIATSALWIMLLI